MKAQFIIRLLMVFASLYFISCTKDIDQGENTPEKPYFKVIKDGEVSEIYTNVPLGGFFEVHLMGNKASAPLRSLRFIEEGYTMPANRIIINDQEISTNPIFLDERNIYSLEMMVKIISHEEFDLRKKYTIILDDQDGNTSSVVLWLKTIIVNPEIIMSANDNHEIIVPPGELVSVHIIAKKGSFGLSSISVLLKNDYRCHSVTPELIKPADIYFGNTMIPALSNPVIMNKTDSKGFDKTLYIRVPSVPGLYAYCIMLQDGFENTVDDWFKVKVMDFEESALVPLSEIK